MNASHHPERAAQPGDWVRWRHPRLALARGWFNAYGPGPFEVMALLPSPERALPVAYLVRTAAGEHLLDAAWVGVPARLYLSYCSPPGD
jgi:hypothetical protein